MAVRAADLETRLYVQDRDYNRGLQDAERRTDKFVRDVNGKLREVGTGRFAGVGASGGGFLPGLGHISEIIQGIPQIGRLAGALVSPLTDAAQAGIRYNMTLENARIGLEGVAGSAERAQAHISALQAFGERTPFEFTGLLQASRYMTTFGFGLQEQIPLLTSWGNAVAASGDISEETLTGVIRAFGQMRALQRVNSEEMSQLAERGIPSWELLAKAIGKSVEETRKLGEQGRLNGPAAVRAITAMMDADPRFSGQMDRMSRTLTGRLSNLADVQGRAGGLATQNLSKDISDALAAALSRGSLAEDMAGNINAAITPVSGLIRGAIVTTVGGGLTGGFEAAFNAAKAVLPVGATSLINDGVLGPMLQAAGVQSPSTKTYYIGQMLAEGLENGFTDRIKGYHFSEEIEKLIREAAERFGLDPALIRAVIRKESRGRKGATSPVGAAGLMQLMPGTAARYGVNSAQRYDPRSNVMAGSAYLADLLRMFGGREDLALAGYNWGEHRKALGTANRTGQSLFDFRLPAETYHYVKQIQGELERVRSGNPFGVRLPIPGTGPRVGFTKTPVYENGEIVGYNATDPRDMGLTGGASSDVRDNFPILSTKMPEFTLTASKAVSTLKDNLRSATDIQFDLLKAMGDAGPVAEQGFGQAGAAVENWYAQVVDSGKKAKTVLGITGRDAAEAFEDAWVGAFTQTDLNFKNMASSLVLTFTQSINQMVQQWAAAQISAGLGKFLSWGLNALFGGIGGAGMGAHSAMDAFSHRGYATGGSFIVGGQGGTDKTPVAFMATKGEQVTVETPAQARQRGATVINNNVTNIIYSPRVTPSSYTSRRSTRESFESLLRLAG